MFQKREQKLQWEGLREEEDGGGYADCLSWMGGRGQNLVQVDCTGMTQARNSDGQPFQVL
jgi:hypothetical protein